MSASVSKSSIVNSNNALSLKKSFAVGLRLVTGICLFIIPSAFHALAQLGELQFVNQQHKVWEQYGGGPDQSKYMDLKQITKANVSQLEVIWNYADPVGGRYFFNPIVVNGVMYVVAKGSSVVALDAASGRELWGRAVPGIVQTGINYWESKDGKDRRLIICASETLQALDAATGQSITNFGNHGSTSLKEGLGRDPATIGREQSTAPGQIYDNLIFLGSSPGESYFDAPGHLRAYDVVTGKLVWVFHTIPWPGEYGYETWPKDAYKYMGGVNTWGEITVDEKHGIVFFPLGAPTYDYYGADRTGDDLYDECILALDARTGKRLWHFQTVHHGLWDYDLCAAPQLITVQHEGKTVEAVAVAGKTGFLYVFNRITGEPLWPIEERPVPPSDMPEDHASPTQPFPTVVPPFTRQTVTTNDINPYFPAQKREALVKRVAAAHGAKFQPLSDKYEVITMPSSVGGANRGCTAADPDKGIVYVIAAEFASLYTKMRREPPIPSASVTNVPAPAPEVFADRASAAKTAYAQTCVVCHGANLAGIAMFPAITNAGAKLTLDQFKAIVSAGKGQMPGFPHIDDGAMAGLYAMAGGTVEDPGGRRGARGASAQGGFRGRGRSVGLGPNGAYGYPEGVRGPTNNYATSNGNGMDNRDLLSPPWSTITAYDLNKGTIKWQSPLGQDPKIKPVDGKMTGLPNGSERRGMLVTSTGLVFSTCLDGKLYAYDADNGNLLWGTQLPRNTEGLPAMYEVNGRAYIAICLINGVVDQSKPELPPGYVVYGLPEKK